MIWKRTFLAMTFATLLASGAHAQVSFYTLFRTNAYTQTSATTTSFDGVYLSSSIVVTDPNDYGAGTLTDPMSVDHAYTQAGTSYNFGTSLYASDAALETDFPHGTYTYSLDAGSNFGAATATLDDTTDRWSPSIPVVQEYDALQTATAGQGFTIHVDGFTPGTGTNDNLSFYDLLDFTTNQLVPGFGGTTFDGNPATPDNVAFSFNIPTGLLLAGHDYGLRILYSSRFDTQGGFGGAATFDGYDNLTTVRFSVAPVPEPMAFAPLGIGLLAIRRRRRR